MAASHGKNPGRTASGQTRTEIDSLQILSFEGTLFNHVDDGLPMWAGEGDRILRQKIMFAHPFDMAPNVTLGLTGIDAAHDQNLRFRLQAINVTKIGFTVEFATWGDTHIARAALSWQAIGRSTSSGVKPTPKRPKAKLDRAKASGPFRGPLV